jgi:hypothetical protein
MFLMKVRFYFTSIYSIFLYLDDNKNSFEMVVFGGDISTEVV